MTRANFAPLKVDDGDVFAVKISGHLGTRQKMAVEALVGRCLENGKNKVVFDLSELSSMGGAVAQVFGDFTGRLHSQGQILQVVGASDVVRSFLRGKCAEAEPNFVDSMSDALELMKQVQSATPPEEPVDEIAGAVEELSPVDVQHDANVDAESEPDPRDVPEALPDQRFVSLEDADRWIAEAETPRQKKAALKGLLFGADLAEACYLLHRSGNRLIDTDDESLSLPVEGGVAKALVERRAPIPIVDLGDCQLQGVEADVLTKLNCQMAVPVLDGADLQGVLFLRKAHAGEEYDPGEALALDLLVRHVGHRSDPTADPSTRERETRDLKERVYRHQTLARISKDFNSIHDEDHLLNVILVTLMSELGATRVAYYETVRGGMEPRASRGIDRSELSPTTIASAKALLDWNETLVSGRGKGAKPLQDMLQTLNTHGFTVLTPLRSTDRVLGCVALGGFRDEGDARIDLEYLQSVLQHAGIALMNTQAFRSLHAQTLRISRTIMGLAERRAGIDSGDQNDYCALYVSRIARAMNHNPDEMRDLIFATVLRDIGMIEISDVVLRSPRKLSPEEWKLVQRHPIHGAEILRDLDFSEDTCATVMHHHERYNGEGYPHGLRGHAIPAGARMISVVESYLAMTRELPYRAALSKQEAMDVLLENWEMRYDPEIVGAFIDILKVEVEPAEPSIGELLTSL